MMTDILTDHEKFLLWLTSQEGEDGLLDDRAWRTAMSRVKPLEHPKVVIVSPSHHIGFVERMYLGATVKSEFSFYKEPWSQGCH